MFVVEFDMSRNFSLTKKLKRGLQAFWNLTNQVFSWEFKVPTPPLFRDDSNNILSLSNPAEVLLEGVSAP